tara:strand:+ start:363 stop:566 length:204 start_codon:yes stop_codon:yes gene_type:complete
LETLVKTQANGVWATLLFVLMAFLAVPQTAVSAVSGVQIDTRAYQSTETTEIKKDDEEEEEEEPDCE